MILIVFLNVYDQNFAYNFPFFLDMQYGHTTVDMRMYACSNLVVGHTVSAEPPLRSVQETSQFVL